MSESPVKEASRYTLVSPYQPHRNPTSPLIIRHLQNPKLPKFAHNCIKSPMESC